MSPSTDPVLRVLFFFELKRYETLPADLQSPFTHPVLCFIEKIRRCQQQTDITGLCVTRAKNKVRWSEKWEYGGEGRGERKREMTSHGTAWFRFDLRCPVITRRSDITAGRAWCVRSSDRWQAALHFALSSSQMITNRSIWWGPWAGGAHTHTQTSTEFHLGKVQRRFTLCSPYILFISYDFLYIL